MVIILEACKMAKAAFKILYGYFLNFDYQPLVSSYLGSVGHLKLS